ncbi:PROC [Symbiodinium sp. KB8]|nr:PROC [Symbiodinium sp. KB8]
MAAATTAVPAWDEVKVAFIGGGAMSSAVLEGALASGRLAPEQLVVATPHPEKLEAWSADTGVRSTADNRAAADGADVVFLGVKPHIIPAAVEGFKDLPSMATGKLVVQCTAAAVCAGPGASEADVSFVSGLFGTLGSSVVVKEAMMDGVTGVSGSGPAFIFMLIEAMSDGGVAMGLPRDVALQLAAQTVKGAAEMVLDSGMHPGQLKDKVASPGGTTIAGIHALEKAGFRGTVMDAVVAAGTRSQELSR